MIIRQICPAPEGWRTVSTCWVDNPFTAPDYALVAVEPIPAFALIEKDGDDQVVPVQLMESFFEVDPEQGLDILMILAPGSPIPDHIYEESRRKQEKGKK